MASAVRTLLHERPEIEVVALGSDAALERLEGAVPHESAGPFDGTALSAGRISLRQIRRAVELALAGEVFAIVTGPVHKPALHEAGSDAPGQTELLGELVGAERVGMLMNAESTRLGPPLRILLATTHLALRDVPARLSSTLVEEQVRLLDDALRARWRIPTPRIALCALNPHASDGGLFGDEEERILRPAATRLRESGVDVTDPLPADTVFLTMVEGTADAIVVPYHDVGMAVFKTLSFGRGVNVTLGLPFVRTSPDHGTAFDLAGTGQADPASALEALRLAVRLACADGGRPL